MAFRFSFYPEYEFAYTQCYGVIDDRSMHIHLVHYNLEAEALQMTTIRELADTRSITRVNKATVKGFIELAGLDMDKSADRREYLAVLADDALIEQMARLYGDAIKSGKEGVAIFQDANEALTWLGYTRRQIPILRKFIHKNRV